MYTGDERDTPSEKIQSEFLFEKKSSEGFDPKETREYDDEEDSEEDPIADGGFEYRRVFEGDIQDIAREATAYDGGVRVAQYDGKVAFQGNRSDVTEFVHEVRQEIGAEDKEGFFNIHIHDEPSTQQKGSYTNQKVAADGGYSEEGNWSHTTPHGEGTQEVFERGPQEVYEDE